MDRLRAMEVFIRIVEAGSLSGAARQTQMANGSISELLRQLEARLGTVLVRRSTRHVQITEEGAAYYERCRAILAEIGEAEAALGNSPTLLRGVLQVEMPIAFGQLLLGPALAGFAALHPNLQVRANLTNEVNNLIKRGVDVAVRMDEVEDVDLVARPIYRSSHMLCASPAFLARHGTPSHPNEIDPKHCLGFMSHPDFTLRPWRFGQDGARHTVVPQGNLSFNSTDALMQTAARETGMIYVLEILARRHCEQGHLVPLLRDWQTDSQIFYAVYPKTRFTPAKVRAFIGFLLGLFPDQADVAPGGPVPVRNR